MQPFLTDQVWSYLVTPLTGIKNKNPVDFREGFDVNMEDIESPIFECYRITPSPNNEGYVTRRKMLLTIHSPSHFLIELVPLRGSGARVFGRHYLPGLDRLKYKKDFTGVLVLFFKNGTSLKYAMANCKHCVDEVQKAMFFVGIDGGLNRANESQLLISTAKSFELATLEIESKFASAPSLVLVENIMELLREATERFSAQGDNQYTATVNRIHNFLLRDDVAALLDASHSTKGQNRKSSLEAGTAASSSSGSDTTDPSIYDASIYLVHMMFPHTHLTFTPPAQPCTLLYPALASQY